ncbi:MAG TPA: AAA family ATPase [Phycisphaerae bacterium]|jgi:chromosome partitioning protein|nr:AAA family ATPase [Phycisphaerae bacterium]HOB73716.1 AAA family ATPase [Phycisphaerae bacterium]HOJ53410.1 AAA family ATPase [Phycisphaerae bacterium]HOL25466.1 AAA family ATPase [Phycisphaerae bacterium]HPP19857.1 AAA family ATPase [Phycisphaerae bacterium]
MRRIAVINQKGGVGKTTTAVNLGAALARAGNRVLLIDLDPQAHLSLHLGQDPTAGLPGSYELLTGSASIAKVRNKVGSNLWVVPASIDLAAAEVELVSVVGREVILRDLLDQHVGGTNGRIPQYDYVLMDCPPSLGVLTLNGLCAAKEVFIPLQPHYLALQGLGKLLETVSLVSRRINPELKVTGIVVCMHDAGTRLASEVIDDVRSFLEAARNTPVPWADARLFETMIRRNIKLAEAPSYGKSIFDYAADSNGAKDYEQLARQVQGLTDPPGDAQASVPDAPPVPEPAQTPVAEPGHSPARETDVSPAAETEDPAPRETDASSPLPAADPLPAEQQP